MKILFVICWLAFVTSSSYCQQSNPTIESNYSVRIKGKIDMGGLTMLDSVFVVDISFNVVKDKKFCLFIAQVQSISNSMFPISGEQDPDSLLFDLDKRIVYDFAKMKSFSFKAMNYQLPDSMTDTIVIQKKDTVIVLLKSLDKNIIPTPTIGILPYGVSSYTTKKFVVTYLNSRKSSFSLLPLYARCKDFEFTNTEFEFQF